VTIDLYRGVFRFLVRRSWSPPPNPFGPRNLYAFRGPFFVGVNFTIPLDTVHCFFLIFQNNSPPYPKKSADHASKEFHLFPSSCSTNANLRSLLTPFFLVQIWALSSVPLPSRTLPRNCRQRVSFSLLSFLCLQPYPPRLAVYAL